VKSQTMSKKQTLEGTLVLGTEQGCGKTVLVAGLAMALSDAGFRVQAFKPLEFGVSGGFSHGQDQAYINKMTGQYILVETVRLASAWDMTVPTWNRLIEHCKTLQYPCILEGPGQVASAWRLSRDQLVDGLDVAQLLGFSILLVAKTGPDFFEKTRAALEFIRSRGQQAIGFVQVDTMTETLVDEDKNQAEKIMLSHHYGTPFLGHFPYSPSISVPTHRQGNLMRMTQDNIDLLPLQLGMGLTL